MRILIQNVKTRMYYSLLDIWTRNPQHAYDFRHSDYAFDFARRNELRDVQLVVKFIDAEWDQVVPLPVPAGQLSARPLV